MPQHRNAQSFAPGDPRAIAAGKKGGQHRRIKSPSPDYTLGYRAGARNARRHIRRWIEDHAMSTFTAISQSPFAQAAMRLHKAQLAADTPAAREAADAALSHLLRMAGYGRFDEWLASHPDPNAPAVPDLDDSMFANPEGDTA